MKRFAVNLGILSLLACINGWSSVRSFAQAIDVTEETRVEGRAAEPAAKSTPVGEPAARKYFQTRQDDRSEPEVRTPSSSGPRYMALTLGTYLSEDVYKWGKQNSDDIGRLDAGVTYRIGEWTNSMDLIFRANLTTYDLGEKDAVKLSLMPGITFPDAASEFPLYFGGAAGLGIFFKQVPDESSLSFDYNLMVGARFFDLFEGMGLLFETGLKSHVLLLSDGQYNGLYVNFGTVFRF